MSNNLSNTHRKKRPDRPEPSTIPLRKYRRNTCISDLSDEMVLKILLELPEADLVFNVPRVCKRWKTLIGDRKLSCKKLFACSRVRLNTLLKWIKASPLLEDLSVPTTRCG